MYCIAESLSLLLIDGRDLANAYFGLSPNTLIVSLVLLQAISIPGLAVMFSYLQYGKRDLARRTVAILLAFPAGVALFASLLAMLYPLEWLAESGVQSSVVDAFVLIIAAVGICWLLVRSYKRAARKSVELEAARWLEERQSEITIQQRRLRTRRIQLLCYIPALIVLLTFKFLFPALGILSHVGRSRVVELGNYELVVPPTWLQADTWVDEKNHESSVSGWIASPTTVRFEHPQSVYVPVSDWWVRNTAGVRTQRLDVPSGAKVLSSRILTVAGESITCVEYTLSYDFFWSYGLDSHRTGVRCGETGPISAGLDGDSSHIVVFLRVLQGIHRR